MVLGEQITGEILVPGEYDEFSFDATAGQDLFLDVQVATSADLVWSLNSPSGNEVFSQGVGIHGSFTLEEDGQYALVVDGPWDRVGAYKFALCDVATTLPAIAPMARSPGTVAVGEFVAGQIAMPGEVDTLVFEAAAGDRLAFDVSNNSAYAFVWTLTDPTGVQVFSQSLDSTGPYASTGPHTLSESGQYVLSIESPWYSTGAYEFVIQNLASPVSPIALGEFVAGQIAMPGEVDTFTFEATAGNSLLFNTLYSSNGSFTWMLTDPTGAVVFYDYINSTCPVTMPESGQYVLSIDSYWYETGTYEFVVEDLSQVVATITLGEVITDQIAMPGEVDTFTFNATAGDSLSFDTLYSSTDSFTWMLTDPTGAVVFYDYMNNTGPVTMPESGQYALSIDSYWYETGTYQFAVENTAAPMSALTTPAAAALASATMLIGDVVSGDISVGGEIDVHAFDATAGQELFFDLQSGSGADLKWTLTAPSGSTSFDVILGDQGPITLDETGQYELSIAGRDATKTGAYQFQINDVTPAAATAITVEQTVDGEILVPSEYDLFTFDATAGQTLYFDLLAGSSSTFAWKLTSPGGTDLFYVSIRDLGPITLTETGTYTLLVDGQYDRLGAYQFVIHDVPDPTTTAIMIGQTVDGEILVTGEYDLFTFDATAGQTLYFDLLAGSSSTFAWKLTSPGGTDLFYVSIRDLGPITLTETGTYTLLVDGQYDRLGAYQFVIHDVPDPTTTAIMIGQTVDGEILVTGEYDLFTFDATAGQTLYFDLLAGSSSTFAWKLTSPGGTDLFYVSIRDQGPITLTETGTYTLLVDGQYDRLGAYAFEIDALQTIGFDTPISGVAEGEDVSPYVFTADAGSPLFLDVIFNESSKARFQLIAPSGANVFTQASGDQSVASLPETGSYTLLVSGNGSMSNPLAFHFQITQGTVEPPMPLGADLVVSEITAPTKLIANPAQIDISWTVTNSAATATTSDKWFDRLVFSMDSVIGNADDRFYAEVVHDGVLSAGASYTQTQQIAMPADYYGEFYVAVETDVSNHVYEGTAETNNTAILSQPTTIYRDAGLPPGPPLIELDLQDEAEFPSDTTVVLSGQALGLGGTANLIFAIDVSASTGFIDGLDANYDGVVDAMDDINSDGDIGNILDVEIGSLLRIVEMMTDQGIAINLSVVVFAGTAQPIDLTPLVYNQSFVTPEIDEDANGYADFEEAVRSSQIEGVGLFRSIDAGYGTNFLASSETIEGLVQRAPDADRTQILFLTDGEATTLPEQVLLEQLGALGVNFHAFQITGTEVSDSLANMADVIDQQPESSGDAILVTDPNDLARALAGTLDIVGVSINGVAVASFDTVGNFFSPVDIHLGPNEFIIEVIDSAGNRSSRTITLYGVDPGTQVDLSSLSDVTLSGRLDYQATTFNRQTNTLHAETTLTNVSEAILDAPVVTVYDPFTPASVTLVPSDGFDADGHPMVIFDTEIPTGELPPGSTSQAIPLAFANPARDRFAFEVTLLASGNHAPIFTSVPQTEATLDVAYQYRVSAIDVDGHPVFLELTAAPAGMTFDPVDARIDWMPTVGQEGTHRIELTATDDHGGWTTQTFQLNTRLSPPNRPPVFRSAPATTLSTGQDYVYTPDVLDLDGDPLTFFLDDAPAGMTHDPATGTLTWTAPADGTYAVRLRVEDGQSGVAVQGYQLAVGVVPTNPGAPAILSSPLTQAGINSPYLYLPRAEDPDGDTPTFTLMQSPSGMEIDPVTGRIDWTPTTGQLGTHAVLLSVDDGRGGQATQFYNIEVTADPPNRAPVIVSAPLRYATHNEAYAYQIDAIDADGDPITYQLSQGPAGMTLDSQSGLLSWTPLQADLGIHTIELRAVDPSGDAGIQTIELSVLGPNDRPVFSSEPILEVSAGATYRYDADATDADALIYSLVEAPTDLTINSRTGILNWSTSTSDLGTHAITVRATDQRGAHADQPYTLTVVPDTQPPSVSILASEHLLNVGDIVTIRVMASDNVAVDSLTLQVDGISLPLDTNGTADYTITTPGMIELLATATDTSVNIGTTTDTLRVFDPTDTEPPFVEITSPSFGDTVTYLTDIIGTVTDPNLEFYRLEYALAGTDQWTTFHESNVEVVDGVLGVFDPTMLANDIYEIRVMAQDVNGQIWYERIELSIAGNAKLGNFRLEFQDLNIPLAGIPIQISRIYDTLDVQRNGDFGFGWSLAIANPQIHETVRQNPLEESVGSLFGAYPFRDGTRVYLTNPDGYRVGFTFTPDREDVDPITGFPYVMGPVYRPRFTPDPGVYDTLEVENLPLSQKSDGTFTLYLFAFPWNPSEYQLTTKDGTTYHYDQFAGLQTITDTNNNVLTYTDTGIYSTTGQSITWTRDDQNRITEIIDPAGNARTYEYSDAGDLTLATDQAGIPVSFQYYDDPAHYMSQYNLGPCSCPNRIPLTRIEYDDSGRVSAMVDALGNPITQTYDLANNTETIADRLGNETTLTFDDRGNITQETNPLGHTSTYVYDADDNVTSITNPRGYETTFNYDDRGNVTSFSDAQSNLWDAVYNQFNEISAATDPLGRTTTYIYDTAGNLIELINAAGTSSYLGRDDEGRISSITDNLGNTTTFSYGDGALPTLATNPDGSSREFDYNYFGLVTRFADETGAEVHFSYDAGGNLLSMQDATGGETTFAYQATRLASVTDPLGRITSFEYDEASRRVLQVDPLGGETHFTYDANNRITSVTDPLGRVTTSQYDAVGNLIASINPLNDTTAYQYDENGNLTTITDPLSHTTTYEYDSLDRFIGSTDPLGAQTVYAYDAIGNLLSSIDPLNRTIGYAYDALNRLSSITDPLDGVVSYDYDDEGNLLSRTDQNDNATNYTYNDRNRLLTRTNAEGNATTYAYDLAGRLISETDALLHATTYDYDLVGRLTSVTNALGGVNSWTYDLANNQITSTDPLDRVTTHAYDDLNRPISTTDHTGAITQFEYDAVGNRTRVVDPASNAWTFAYNDLDRLVSQTDPLDGITAWTHDADGNVLTATDPLGRVTSYTYDDVGQLLSATDPAAGVTGFVYDAVGNLTSTTDPLDNTWLYAHDDLDRLTTETDPLGATRTYTYDAVGNWLSQTDRNGRVTTFQYDRINRLTQEQWWDNTTSVNTLDYTYDAVGNLLAAGDAFSNYTYTHDDLGRTLTVDNAGTPNAPHVVLTHAYDAVGNRLSTSDNLGVQVLSTYDARNLLSSRTWQGTGIDPARAEFDYNALGQTTELRRFADASGTSQIGRSTFDYDAKGRLTDLTHRDALDAVLADYDYVRDLADQLTSETHHGETHDYTHDPTGQLTAADHAVADDEAYTYDANGNRTTAGHVTGPGNRLLSDGTHNFAYDAEGNLVTKTEIATGDYTEYTYDHRNRLVSAQDKSSGGIILAESTYTYDLFDRRIAKTVDPDGPGPQPSETTRFIYDGSHVWADFDAANTILARYLFGDKVDQLLARHRPAEGTAWHLTDHLGTVRDIAGATGVLINHLDYDSFGNVLVETNPLFGDRYRFTGREFDPELGLYYYRARYYDPSTGRFTTEDPIAFAGGDANLYRYVANSPLTYVDPWGLTVVVSNATLNKEIVARDAYAVAMLGCLSKAIYSHIMLGLIVGRGVGMRPINPVMTIASCQAKAAAAAQAAGATPDGSGVSAGGDGGGAPGGGDGGAGPDGGGDGSAPDSPTPDRPRPNSSLPDRVTDELPAGESRTPAENAQARNFFKRNRKAAEEW